ncbi:hypothetical protein NT05LI_3337 [Listeria ivanovii FSL F6-596]|nr:hypothetical protein NT05LI_3337 [Listeria ivanovii FSL F6-596]
MIAATIVPTTQIPTNVKAIHTIFLFTFISPLLHIFAFLLVIIS